MSDKVAIISDLVWNEGKSSIVYVERGVGIEYVSG